MHEILIVDTVGDTGGALSKAFEAAGRPARVVTTTPASAAGEGPAAIVVAGDAAGVGRALRGALALRGERRIPIVLIADLDRSGWDRTFGTPEALQVDALFDRPADAAAVVRRVSGLVAPEPDPAVSGNAADFQAILDRAVANEEAAMQFYRRAADIVNHPDTRESLLALARDEEEHKRMLLSIRSGGRIPEIPAARAGSILTSARGPELSVSMSPADAFLLAAQKEKLAVEFYLNWAALYPAGPERSLLECLADVERQHRVRVENIFTNAAFPESW